MSTEVLFGIYVSYIRINVYRLGVDVYYLGVGVRGSLSMAPIGVPIRSYIAVTRLYLAIDIFRRSNRD